MMSRETYKSDNTDHRKPCIVICVHHHLRVRSSVYRRSEPEENNMIKAGIIGSTGYAGAELVRILSSHPDVEIVWYGSRSYIDQEYASVYGNFFEIVDAKCLDDNLEMLSDSADVIFTATPQGFCASVMSDALLKKAKIIDLSADFRLKDVAVYEAWYNIVHKSPQFLDRAVYGLCELYREQIRGADLVANPGCYTTCSILTLYPLVKNGLIDPASIIIDAKSGTSGAGRGAKVPNLFCEVNESMKAYGVTTHRHTPEIEEQLSAAAGQQLRLSFTPHLVPMNRGILATCYASLKKGVTNKQIADAYESCYGQEPFIRLRQEGNLPETRWVKGSNYVDIGFRTDERTGRVIAIGAIDNLVKGAAGQAVQNMNLMFSLEEQAGLKMIPAFP